MRSESSTERPTTRSVSTDADAWLMEQPSVSCETSTIGSAPTIAESPLMVWSDRNSSRTAFGWLSERFNAASIATTPARALVRCSSTSARYPTMNSAMSSDPALIGPAAGTIRSGRGPLTAAPRG